MKLIYLLLSTLLFAVFIFCFAVSALSICLVVAWRADFEPAHAISILATFISWFSAHFVLKKARKKDNECHQDGGYV